jgi:hypothetical protein
MRRRIPLTIAFICGVVMIIQFYIPHRISQEFYRNMLNALIIVGIFYYILAVTSLVRVHSGKIRRKRSGWGFSYVTIISLVVTALIGVLGGAYQPTKITAWFIERFGAQIEQGTLLMVIYTYIQIPMGATMFSLLAFFIASAAFRAFKARSLTAVLLLVTAFIVMLGRVPIGQLITRGLPEKFHLVNVVEWILNFPNMAAQRGILMGVGLGMIATSLKIILGIERGYLGGGD